MEQTWKYDTEVGVVCVGGGDWVSRVQKRSVVAINVEDES